MIKKLIFIDNCLENLSNQFGEFSDAKRTYRKIAFQVWNARVNLNRAFAAVQIFPVPWPLSAQDNTYLVLDM